MEGDANPRWGCSNLLFRNIFAENCMKMEEFRIKSGRASLASALGSSPEINIIFWEIKM